MLTPPVKRSAAEPAIRPTMFAAGALRANGHKQAIAQQDQEMVFRNSPYPFHWQKQEGSCTSATVTPHISSILIAESV